MSKPSVSRRPKAVEAETVAKAALERAVAEVKRARMREVKNLFDAAAAGRRTSAWRTGSLDANAENWAALAKLRDVARDMVRNNAYARRAKMTIQNNVIGAGIVPRVQHPNQAVVDAVMKHFETTAIHASGQMNLYGLQNVAMGMVPESGEAIVRLRPRRTTDGLPLPFQLQLLEGDYLDHSKNGTATSGNINISGVEFDLIGRRAAYWIYPVHPGAQITGLGTASLSQRVDSRFIAHVHRIERDAEEVRGMTWYAPVILRMRDFADFVDAQLMRQKIAACFSVFITDNGEFTDTTTDANEAYPLEAVEPGLIHHLKNGEEVHFGNPPGVADFSSYSAVTLREIAMGLGITYEALTGDLTGVNYSSGRMGWLEYQRNIDAWRWVMFVPQFLDRLTEWTNDAVKMQFGADTPDVKIDWTPPRREMIDPVVELEAAGKAIRMGLSSRSEEIRTLGRDPVQVDEEMAADNERADKLELTLDSDPRKTTANGNAVAPPAPDEPADTPDPAAAPAAMMAQMTASFGDVIKAVAERPADKPQAITYSLPEKVIVDLATALPNWSTSIETKDEQGRVKTMIKRPKDGIGPAYRVTAIHDENGKLVGHEQDILEGGDNG